MKMYMYVAAINSSLTVSDSINRENQRPLLRAPKTQDGDKTAHVRHQDVEHMVGDKVVIGDFYNALGTMLR